MSTSRPSPPPQRPYDLDITIVSAKHLKNVNWQNGALKPYAIFWIDPDRRLATKSDDSGSTRPVWNEQFLLPLTLPPQDTILTLEIFHSKPLESSKPLVGILRVALKDLVDSDDSVKLRTFELRRPSGRPQGKIKLKLAVRERPLPDNYHSTPPTNYYYSSAPPPPPGPPRDYRPYSPTPPPPPPHSYGYGPYSDPYSSYSPHSGYFSSQQPPVRPYYHHPYGSFQPSAPVEYAPPVAPYDQKLRSGKMGMGTGLAVGAVAGALGGLALEEGIKYEEEKIAERAESESAARDDYRDYRSEY